MKYVISSFQMRKGNKYVGVDALNALTQDVLVMAPAMAFYFPEELAAALLVHRFEQLDVVRNITSIMLASHAAHPTSGGSRLRPRGCARVA
jgi:phosphopantothenoylcysteine synthetase/decarboxylase